MNAVNKVGLTSRASTQSPLCDLEAIIRSRIPLVAIESVEEAQVVRLVRQLGVRLQLKAYRWTVTDGLQACETCDQPLQAVVSSQDVLRYIRSSETACLFILLDFHPFIEDPVHVRLLKDIALTYSRHHCTVMLMGHTVQLPEELRPYAARFSLPLPTLDQLRGIVMDVAGEWGAENGRQSVETTNKAFELLVRNLVGLTATDARRLARKAIEDDGAITPSDIPAVMRAKYELLGNESALSFEYETTDFSQIGGLSRLRRWLEQRRTFFSEGTQTRLDPPRGVFLLGVQGCGKSLAAKAAASILSVPLLRLDFGVLYNKYYGETERNLRKALETAEILAPCVLWMDEIEKGISVGDEDDGLSRRILGTLLTWMSEKKSSVFLVATANDIGRLPPELIRKGRFDEIFFADLPTLASRRQILSIHLQKRGLIPVGFNLDALAEATEGFSGSELEQAIVSAMYSARSLGRDPVQSDLLEEMHQTRPLSVVMEEQVNHLRTWATGRTVPCD